MPISLVLVVDDSPTERLLMTRMLETNGYRVAVAESGEDGVNKAKELKPDLVLMDVVMPGLNGFQATRMISRDEETKNIPVIITTTKSEETDKLWGMRQGAKDYVTKPINQDDLLAKIRALG